jgi:hypothetical protein
MEKDKTELLIKIDERLDNLIRENREEHEKILNQTTKTNSRVGHIEDWKAMATGGFVVINALVVPVVLWLFYERLTQ